MTDPQRTASEIINSLGHDAPMKPAGELLDVDAMRREGERQERERQRVIDQANETSRPTLR